MFRLLKNGHCFIPEDSGIKDVLVVYDKILKIGDGISAAGLWDTDIIDCSNKIVCPGLIDQHVHITGGGGEEGPSSRIPELMLSEVIRAGVTTLVGVLGVDGITRNIAGLLTKARALEVEGITTYIYTGSYGFPTATLTGRVMSDITLIDKVIGVGEIAISDHRSSQPTVQQLKELASEARVGGLIGAKAGVMHIHVGEGKGGLIPLLKLLQDSDLPMEMFVPTHINRNRHLFQQAVEYALGGGYIDLTAGEDPGVGYSAPDALTLLLQNGVDIRKITISSDANGSVPAKEGSALGVGKMSWLLDDIKACVLDKGIGIDKVIRVVSTNVAGVLKLHPRKGALLKGSDADIVVFDKKDMNIDTMLVKGEVVIRDRQIIKKGRYEL